MPARPPRLLGCATILLVAACNKPAPAPPSGAPAFVKVATTRQLMEEVFETAADRYWTAVGSTTDKTGTHEHAPKTDAEWTAVRDAATTIAEAGNLLLIEDRRVDDGDWVKFTREMIQAASLARDAAAARDRQRIFDTGADLYDRCTQCHAKYLAPLYPVSATTKPPRTP
ncbi:MAG: hypothetical protein FJ202_01405 [Gemmatimonadetes bacterium]|nr:hypothetical protein [Gemmatimonadota bacterium]